MKIKKFNFKKLAAISTAIALQTSGFAANLNVGFAEEDAPQVIEEVVVNNIEDNMTITIDKVTVEDENNRTTTTTQEASGTYSTREEAEQAVVEAIDHLVDEGYTPTETQITEVPAGSHTEEGEKISESEGSFDTEADAQAAMEERVSELEDQGYRIDSATVSETEEEHQVGTDHNESTETSDITYESEDEAREAAQERVTEIEEGLDDNQTLDSTVEVTTETRKTGETVDHTDKVNENFTYDKELGTYVNDEGVTLDDYIESTKTNLEETGHVNININPTYREGSHKETEEEITEEHTEYETDEEAQAEYERIMSTYTEENGYANVNITKGSHSVKIGEHTETSDEFSDTYNTREEAEQAVRDVVSDLLEEGYEVDDSEISIDERKVEGTKVGETESFTGSEFKTEDEAETAMEERVSELEAEGYDVTSATVSETEEEYVAETQTESGSRKVDNTLESSDAAEEDATKYIATIRTGLNDNQRIEDSSIRITYTAEKKVIGSELDQTLETEYDLEFYYNPETKTYVNKDGVSIDEFIESERTRLAELGYSNIETTKSDYTSYRYETEEDVTTEKYATYDSIDDAQSTVDYLKTFVFTEQYGYGNVTFDINTRQVKDGSHTEYATSEETRTFGSKEEAEAFVETERARLEALGFNVTGAIDSYIVERTDSHYEATGEEYTETSSTPFETEEEARDAMESAMADLEGDYGNIDGTVSSYEELDHYEAGEEQTATQDYRLDGRYTTREEAEAAAQAYISSIPLTEGHYLDYSIEVTSGMASTGEQQVKQTDTVSTMHFTLNENGVYVNEDGIDLDTYVAAAKFAAGQDGYVNVTISKQTYTDGSHTEAGDAIHETGTYATEEEAAQALAQLALKYTEGNGYTNITVGEIVTRQVENGTRTDTDSRESTGISESDRETETQRLVKELTDGGYTVTEQDVESTSFEVTLRDDQGNVVFEENPEKETVSENPIYEDENEYETREDAEARITELETVYQGETKTEGNDEDGYVRYDTSYTFEIKTESSLRTEEIDNETYETEAEALEIIAALKEQGYDVDYVIEPETQTIQVTVNKSFATEEEANNYAEEVRESLDTIYEDIKVSKQRTGETESHKLDLDEEGVTGLTYDQAEERLAELEQEFTDTDETTYEIKIVRAVDDDGEPINMTILDDIKTVEETFTTLDAAKAYIESLRAQGYNDVSDIKIVIDYSSTETWEDQEHGEVDIDPDHEGKIYHYDHLDIIYGGGNGKTTMTYVDLTAEDPSKQTYTIQGALHVTNVIIDNAGVKQNLTMTASVDAGRGDNEYKSERGFGKEASAYKDEKGKTKYHTSHETIFINGQNRYYTIYDESPINDNTIVTIDGTLEYTNPVTGVTSTIPYKLTGKLNGGTNKCQNTSAWGYDLTFSSITIINESVLIDANIDYEYKVVGEAIATHIAEAYDIEVTQTDHEVEYVVTGKGEKEEETGRVILNASASKDITVYTVDVHKVSREFVSKKETRYDIKVTGSKLVQLYKDVYDINLDCNVLDTIIDENQYLDVELTGDIMEDILAQYFGYVINYKDMAPVMAKYYRYNITANEMEEILDIYYDVFVKGEKEVTDYKNVYDLSVNYNKINQIAEDYQTVFLTADLMRDIIRTYYGYEMTYEVETDIMAKYFGYEIDAKLVEQIITTYYDVTVRGHKIVEDFKTVYDLDVDYNVIKTIIDKYADLEITGDIMKDIMTEYFGYIIKLDVMTPIMEKYYGYEISATEMKEILDYYYRVVVKGEKVEIVPIEKEDPEKDPERDPMDIPKTGQNNRLTADLALMASALLAGSALVLKKKKEEEEKGKTLSK